MSTGQLLAVCFVLMFTHFIHANIEVDALVALKDSFDDPSGILQSWDPTLDSPCTFFHVTCNSNNKVTRVDLSNAGLYAESLPYELGNLAELQYLELYGNHISGNMSTVPWLSLTNLVSLDLYSNNLSWVIPGTLSKLSNLAFINLSNNNLDGPLSPEFRDLQNLQELNLSRNSLGWYIPEQWGDGFPNLRVLDLSYNNLTGTVPPALVDKFKGPGKSLNLAHNPHLTS